MNLTKGVSVGALLLGLVLAPFFSVCAQEALVGTWVLDPAASTTPPGSSAPTAGTLEIKNVGGGQFIAITETTAGGMVARNEITYAVDGKDYPFTYTPATPGRPPTTHRAGQRDALQNLDPDRWAGDPDRDDRRLRRRQDADTEGDGRGTDRRLVERVGVSTRALATSGTV